MLVARKGRPVGGVGLDRQWGHEIQERGARHFSYTGTGLLREGEVHVRPAPTAPTSSPRHSAVVRWWRATEGPLGTVRGRGVAVRVVFTLVVAGARRVVFRAVRQVRGGTRRGLRRLEMARSVTVRSAAVRAAPRCIARRPRKVLEVFLARSSRLLRRARAEVGRRRAVVLCVLGGMRDRVRANGLTGRRQERCGRPRAVVGPRQWRQCIRRRSGQRVRLRVRRPRAGRRRGREVCLSRPRSGSVHGRGRHAGEAGRAIPPRKDSEGAV